MNPDVLQDLQRRLRELERTAVRYRAGEITGTGPLDVALGGSSVPYEDVRSVSAVAHTTGDQVATLAFGNDMLVLGRLGAGDGSGTVRTGAGTLTWPGGSPFTNTLTLAHGLGETPSAAVATATLAAASQVCSVSVVAVDGTNVQWRGYATDDVSPAAATTKVFYWAVFA